MSNKDWFGVEPDGLRKILERRGKAWAIFELIQNSWDADDCSEVKVTLETIPNTPQVWLTVEDNAPEGFHDLTHTHQLFAESRKKKDATKRGRFNFGCKLVLAMCREAEVISTTGGVKFDSEGRRPLRVRRQAGSSFHGRLEMTRDELADVESQVYRLLTPPTCTTTVTIDNGARRTVATLGSRDPDRSFEAGLQTEIADEEGFLRRTERKTTVHLHRAEPAFLYELGIPVMSLDGPWSADVQQKLPLNLDRDSVPPAFVSKLQTLIANETVEDLHIEDFVQPWMAEVVQDKNVAPGVVDHYLHAKYGDKFVIDVPGSEGQESGRKAVANGYVVIRGGAEGKATWEKIKEHQLAPRATELFPPPARSNDYRTLLLEDLSPRYVQLVNYSLELAARLLGCEIIVRVIDGPNLSSLATWHRPQQPPTPPMLTLNRARLGLDFFDDGPTVEVNELLLHEFAHSAGDHLSREFDDAMANLGAKLAELALKDARFFIDLYSPSYTTKLLDE